MPLKYPTRKYKYFLPPSSIIYDQTPSVISEAQLLNKTLHYQGGLSVACAPKHSVQNLNMSACYV